MLCCTKIRNNNDKKPLTFDKAEFTQIANPLLELRFLGSVKFRTLVQHLEHTGGIQPQDKEFSQGRYDLTDSTASSHPGSGVVEVFCLGLCEAHIKQRAQGQFCVNFPSRLTDSVVVFCLLQCAVRSAEAAKRLEATSPKLSSDDHGVGVSDSPVINLLKTNKQKIFIYRGTEL